MAEHRLQESPKKMGPSGTGPQPLEIRWRYTHQPGVKCVWVQVCPCRASNRYCMSVFPLGDFRNKGHTRYPPPGVRKRSPTAPRRMTNMNRNIKEASNYAPILCQSIPRIITHHTNGQYGVDRFTVFLWIFPRVTRAHLDRCL